MRAIWKGAITFGLVNVPVKVYSATQDHDIALHQVHDKDGGRIRYQRRCEVCGKVVDFADIDKAYDDGERTVVLTDEDLSSLPEERRTLEETDRTAIVHFALRQKTRLGALRVRGDVLMLQSLLWDDEVREATFPALDERVRISQQELQMSAALVESFETDFDPSKFTDDYQEQLRELIEAKLEKGDALDTGETFGETGEKEGGGEVLDLMEALRRSVERSRGGTAAAGGAKGADRSGAKPASRAASSGSKTAAKTGSKTGSKGTTKTPDRSASKPASKPAAKASAKKSA